MFKKLTLAAAALATVATAAAPTAASAQSWRGDRYEREYRGDRGYREYRGDRGYYNDRGYNRRSNRGCENGDGGTVIGAIAGGLLGNTVAGRGDRLLGTIIGGGVGAVAGRAIDKADAPRYCRR
ncbi:glycine zipper 2TM domain-containing protein [Sphingomonas sp. 2R-10]|uniref:glycine zipper 2TM domain-containing protein n=1 Tax=Sphingomonas sp. 2R-10 TaxID=3045148 RepID=UPI000F76D047|nr:glycine zipper 2TM domain-containing protein [Sphingomonas sp. 2R-10]MDJ0278720.1 glycine zipper 2TM domain-containing protein [Sphingomonas sp. 2R-10]